MESNERISSDFGRIPLQRFLSLWKDPAAIRFRYRPIRLVGYLIGATLLGLWGYYLYTLFWGIGLTFGMVIFGMTLFGLSGFVLLRLLGWRLFVLRSAVAITPDALVWRTGPYCYLVPWRLIEPDSLGLESLAFADGSGYDRFVTICVGDSAEPIFLVRLYTRLDQYEVFLGELLQRIPRDKWKKAKAGAMKAQEDTK